MTCSIDSKRYIAGGLSGIIEVVTTHPLDYIKTKKQEYAQRNVSNGNFYKNLIKTKNIIEDLNSKFIVIISPISLQLPHHEKNNIFIVLYTAYIVVYNMYNN